MQPDLRYPIGRRPPTTALTDAERQAALDDIAAAPARLRAAVRGLTETQLDTPYRPDGWTVRQVVHHVPDSHLNAYIRTKLALTEDNPTIKPYDEKAWAELEDTRRAPIETSLMIMDGVHERWMYLLRAMAPSDFARTIVHPENGVMSVDQILTTYAWHGKHHVAHITSLRERNGWG